MSNFEIERQKRIKEIVDDTTISIYDKFLLFEKETLLGFKDRSMDPFYEYKKTRFRGINDTIFDIYFQDYPENRVVKVSDIIKYINDSIIDIGKWGYNWLEPKIDEDGDYEINVLVNRMDQKLSMRMKLNEVLNVILHHCIKHNYLIHGEFDW